MSDWHPEVIKISKIEDLPNSDNLQIVTVLDEYPVIIKRGQFKEGDLAAFICADTVVPDNDFFHFLARGKRDKNNIEIEPPPPVGSVKISQRTIKAKMLRGTYSEGLLVEAPPGFKEGDSVVEFFQLEKRIYDEELPDKLMANSEKAPESLKLFKYDLQGLAKYSHIFQEGEEVLISEKIEGCVSGDTILDTLEVGNICIKDLVNNKLNYHVKSFDHNLNIITYNKISEFSLLENNDDWYEIELLNGTKLRITGNHLVWIENLKCYRRVDELNENDIILLSE